MVKTTTESTVPENGGKSRRNFLFTAAASVAAFFSFSRSASAKSGGGHGKHSRVRWGMAFDLDRCTGCQACVAACSVENNQMLGTPEYAAAGRIVRWLQLVPLVGEGEDARRELVPMPCMQCENPPCTKVCPTSATYINPEGIVGQVYPRCIGCRYCVNACPYTCKHFNWIDPKWPGKMGEAINPDVSVRYKGVTEKCLFCHHRLQRARERASAEGRELRNGEYTPACVAACPADAIVFGDIHDPESKVARQFASPRVFRILEELGTEPKVVYLRKV